MIRACIDREKVLESLNTEEDLLEMSKAEAIYDIRKLRALLHYADGEVLMFDKHNDTQGYLHDFQIWVYVKDVEEMLK